jgi:hypothetical protein
VQALGADVAADLAAMTMSWSPEVRDELGDRAVALAATGVPPAAALIVAVGVVLHD